MGKIFTRKFKSNAKAVGKITIAWVVIGLFLLLYDYLILHSSSVTAADLDWRANLFAQISACLSAGLIGGTAVVLFFHKWLRTMPYGRALFFIFILYCIISMGVGFVAGLIFFSSQMDMPFYSAEVLNQIIPFLFGIDYLRIYLVWLIILMITLVVLLVNDKYGPGVFRDMLLGKYFQPRKEERIFMFLDLRGSTTIAESLGEEKYFEFIREVFADATPAILDTRGEIYQYIGDEILISWKMNQGLRQARCLQCFFEIKKIFQSRSNHYVEKYGIIPNFKAGLHCGPVMAGEIGVVKRDIAFSGDVLNTAARIQGECNREGMDILFSGKLLDKLETVSEMFIPQKIGEIILRGKKEPVVLFSIVDVNI